MHKSILFYVFTCKILLISGCNRHDTSQPSSSEKQPQSSTATSPSPDPSRFATPKTPTTPFQTEPSKQARQQPTSLPTAEQEKLDARIKQSFGANCRFERACDSLVGVDCDAAVDGPYYYAEADTLKIVAQCGGFCMSGSCENCPPPTWTCTIY